MSDEIFDDGLVLLRPVISSWAMPIYRWLMVGYGVGFVFLRAARTFFDSADQDAEGVVYRQS